MAEANQYKPEFAPLDKLLLEGAGFRNPRVGLDKPGLKNFADDIESRGLTTPLKVWVGLTEGGEPLKGDDDKPIKVVISGLRRHSALSLLVEEKRGNGYEKAVPYIPFYGTLLEARLEAMAENIQREDLSDFDTAVEIHSLVEGGLKQTQLVDKLNKSNAWISRLLKAYRAASQPVRTAWQMGKLTNEAVQNITALPEPKQEAALIEQLKARASNKKSEIGKARAKGKKKAGQATRLPNSDMKRLLADLAGVKKDKTYLHGLHEGLLLAAGELEETDLAKPAKDHFKAMEKAREEAEAVAEDDDDND
jgi:ParB-like chromosome segregation protein Spo0J